MLPSVLNYCDFLVNRFNEISEERKLLLQNIADYISSKLKADKPIQLIYICTHNSRRSHFGQIWAAVAASYYKVPGVKTYSGGTVATAFNENAINALKRIGFIIKQESVEEEHTYHVYFKANEKPLECFSKVYDHLSNPDKNFAAIMTCSDAEENCPFIPGAELRIGTTYEDPKAFDHSDIKDQKYSERCEQIALETLYVFSKVI